MQVLHAGAERNKCCNSFFMEDPFLIEQDNVNDWFWQSSSSISVVKDLISDLVMYQCWTILKFKWHLVKHECSKEYICHLCKQANTLKRDRKYGWQGSDSSLGNEKLPCAFAFHIDHLKEVFVQNTKNYVSPLTNCIQIPPSPFKLCWKMVTGLYIAPWNVPTVTVSIHQSYEAMNAQLCHSWTWQDQNWVHLMGKYICIN